MDLLKTLVEGRDSVNNGLGNDKVGPIDGNHDNQIPKKETPEVVIVTPRASKVNETSGFEEKVREEDARMMSKVELLEEKDGEVHVVGTELHQPIYANSSHCLPPYPYLYPPYLNYFTSYPLGPSQNFPINNVSAPNSTPVIPFTTTPFVPQNQPGNARREKVKIDPVSISYLELYEALLKKNLVAPEVPQPISHPPPRWYNPAETCKYHMGAHGHTIYRCWTFKLRVQRLRDAGKVKFDVEDEQSGGANIQDNPLPRH
ncbi:hypothetical protein SESBI_21917 [Sesbania bispinosa]|nr:hypothetical protein SESBI_21917 [Sesbania bispinosa]